MKSAYDAEMIAGIVEGDDPRGFYKKFWATPKMIFGTEPDEKVLRQMIYIRTYLPVLTELLMRKLRLDRDKAEEIVLEFIHSLFASPAIRENAWGKYRYYVSRAVLRFAIRRLCRDASDEKRKLSVFQWMAMRVSELEDIVVNRIFNVELRQIRRALEEGVFDDYLNRGVVNGEIAERDVRVWVATAEGTKTHREVAEMMGDMTVSGVNHALGRVERFFKSHARELRDILRDL